MYVYDKRKGNAYWRDPEKDAISRAKYNQKRRERRAAANRDKPPTLTREERIEKRLSLLPDLFDECQECGLTDDINVYRYQPSGKFVPTSLRSEVMYGYSWERIMNMVKDNDMLCPTCAKDHREAHV